MIAVIFEVVPQNGQRDAYLSAAESLRPQLENIDGFLSIERFESLKQPGKLLSLSFWRDEEAVKYGAAGIDVHGVEILAHHLHEARMLSARLQPRAHDVECGIVELRGDSIYVYGAHGSSPVI